MGDLAIVMEIAIVGVIFVIALNFIFQQQINSSTAKATLDGYASTTFPNYNNATYVNNNFWNIPTGWFAWVGDTIGVAVTIAVGDIGNAFLIFAIPSIVTGLAWMWALLAPIYFSWGVLIYKAVSPFT